MADADTMDLLDLVDSLTRYETADMAYDEVVRLFQYLVDTGLAWQLQGHYGRMAVALIESGDVTPKGAARA